MKQSYARYLYVPIAIFFALILFFVAQTTAYKNSNQQLSQGSDTFVRTLENVKIDFNYDKDTYFISDYATETSIYITSDNLVQLEKETNETTRSLRVTADLTDLAEGTHEVKLDVSPLPTGMLATLTPDTIKVTIGKKETRRFSVVAEVPQDQIGEAHYLKSATVSIDQADVTSDATTISQIDHLVARLPNDSYLTENYYGQVTLQAVDSEGRVLPSSIKPTKADLSVELGRLSKKVPVKIEQTGNLADAIQSVDISLDQKEVTIFGRQEDLDAVSEIIAQIDVSTVLQDEKQTVNLFSDKVSIEPSAVTANIKVTKK